jgi:GT2 family glycosyltransferase
VTEQPTTVAAIVVAYGEEPWLERAIDAIRASEGVSVEVVLVDNGGTQGAAEALGRRDGVTLVQPGTNTGFARGNNLGVAASSAELVACVNPDAVVAPTALAALARAAAQPGVALATASVRLGDDPERIGSGGNDVHFLGLSWSGHHGERAADLSEVRPVTGASGTAFACRREVWDELGGLTEPLFAYCEDAELSLRAWQRGLRVEYVPSAVVEHRYDFDRHPDKFRLLERNRLVLVLTCFGPRHLALVAPGLVALEAAMLGYALRHGWLRAKLGGYRWLWRRRRWLVHRRAEVQRQRTVSERELAPVFSDRLAAGNVPFPAALAPLDGLLAAYWRLVRRFL